MVVPPIVQTSSKGMLISSENAAQDAPPCPRSRTKTPQPLPDPPTQPTQPTYSPSDRRHHRCGSRTPKVLNSYVKVRYVNERTGSPTILPMLRSEGQARVMTAVFISATEPRSIAEIARDAGVTTRVALIEVDRLIDAGLVTEQRRGRARLITPNTANPAVAPLTTLLEVTFGPEPLIKDALHAVDGIQAAYIYGSWAERRTGTPGRPPGDIDVLIVGTADEDELETAVRPLARRLGRTVSITRVRPQRWVENADRGFLATIRSKPTITLIGTPIGTDPTGTDLA